ncbi:MFS general substrate transporter [Lepidopterella palustris CBS 459.81]|uniref:MFS general substrate transporter n=1 Tax=Lepidopterella palustris CBS 459.81 TaxID=1314670 RepID=A0A8E2E1U0_9PEZI|nr:MFS general substrate transporter [Lepidopterella palustris CBS 459.81]
MDQPQPSRRNVALCFLGLCFWNLVVAFDTTALSVTLPHIAEDFHLSSTSAYWTGTCFVLCSAAFQPIFTSFSTIFGRKPVILLALTLFTVGAIVCSTSRGLTSLLIGRCVQGVGAGGLVTLTYVVMADMFSLHERSKYMGVISITWLVGTVCGPILGGGFAQSLSWRWIFYINFPFCGISLLMVVFFMHIRFVPQKCTMEGLKQADWIGSILFVTSLTSFLIAISWGGVMFAWSSWRTILPLVMGIVGLIAWVAYSHFLTANPMIPLRILSDRTTAISYFATLIHGAGQWEITNASQQFALLYYLPLYYQAAKLYSPVISGVALLPQCAISGIATALTGIFIAKTSRIKPFAIAGWTIFTFGLGLLHLLNSSTSVPAWVFINLPSGVGLGILFTALSLATQATAEAQQTPSTSTTKLPYAEGNDQVKAMAAGLNPFFRALGQAIGIAIGQAAFSNKMRAQLGPDVARESTALAQKMPFVGTDRQVLLIAAFVESLRAVWWVVFALCALVGGMKRANVGDPEKERDVETASSNLDVDESQDVAIKT